MSTQPNTNDATTLEPDRRLYSLEIGHNLRAKMAENDLATDTPEFDLDGAIQWVPVQVPIAEIPEYFKPMTGTYSEVSKEAVRLNAVQSGIYGAARPFNFYPSIVEAQPV